MTSFLPVSPVVDIPSDFPADYALDEALARLDGNRVLYAELVRRFSADQGGAVTEAMRRIQAGDVVGAAGILHTLKGLAATLGAGRLRQLAAENEGCLKLGRVPEPAQIAALEDALTATIQVLGKIAAAFASDSARVSASTVDIERVTTLLAEISHLAAQSNLRVFDVYSLLRQEYGHPPDDVLNDIDTAMAQGDFPAVRDASELLLIRLRP